MSSIQNPRLPVLRRTAPAPAPIWQQAAPVLVRGVALVAAGVIGEWMLRSAAKKAASLSFSRRPSAVKAVVPRREVVTVTETVVVQRTVVRRG